MDETNSQEESVKRIPEDNPPGVRDKGNTLSDYAKRQQMLRQARAQHKSDTDNEKIKEKTKSQNLEEVSDSATKKVLSAVFVPHPIKVGKAIVRPAVDGWLLLVGSFKSLFSRVPKIPPKEQWSREHISFSQAIHRGWTVLLYSVCCTAMGFFFFSGFVRVIIVTSALAPVIVGILSILYINRFLAGK